MHRLKARHALQLAAALTVASIGIAACTASSQHLTAGPAAFTPSPTATAAPLDVQTTAPQADPTTSGPALLTIGDEATITGEAGKLSATMQADSPTVATTTGGDFPQTAAHGTYVSFPVTITAAVSGFDVNPLFFYVRMPDGTHYDADAETFSADFGPGLGSATLAAGEKIRGNVTFDLPAAHGSLVYAPYNGALGSWTF